MDLRPEHTRVLRCVRVVMMMHIAAARRVPRAGSPDVAPAVARAPERSSGRWSHSPGLCVQMEQSADAETAQEASRNKGSTTWGDVNVQ